jgi:hypothetical protein
LGWAGISADGAVCSASASDGGLQFLVEGITGQSCESTGQQASDYVQNANETGTISGGLACDSSGAYCMQLDPNASNSGLRLWCYHSSGLGAGQASVVVDVPGQTFGVAFHVGDSNAGYCDSANGYGSPVAGDIPVGYGAGQPIDYCVFGPGQSQPSTCAGDPATAAVGNAKSDPLRRIRCDITGTDGNIYSDLTGTFVESSGVFPSPVCEILPTGVEPRDTKYWEVTPGESDVLLDDLPATSAYGNWAATSPATCLAGHCVEDIVSIGVTPQIDCNATPSATGCDGWFTDPTRSADWQCMYGATAEPIAECNTISQFYKPTALQTGQLYADPATGLAVSGQTSVTPGTIAPGTAPADPSTTRNCFTSGWGAPNPT